MGLFDHVKIAGAKQVLAYIEKDPDTNIIKIVDWMIKFNVAGAKHNDDLLNVRAHLDKKDSSWYRLVKSLWTDIDTGVRKKIFETLVINVGLARQSEKKKNDDDLPMGIMLDQTGATDGATDGAFQIKRLPPASPMTADEYDMCVRKNKRRGVFAYIFTGGAGSISTRDLRVLARIHQDCVFVMMMEAGDVDEQFADSCFAARNIVPMVSRRGCGAACEILRQRRLAYGVYEKCSAMNADELSGDGFADEMVAAGAKLVWIFEDESVSSQAGAAGDEFYEKIKLQRNTKPVLIVDFIHEEQFLGGRISGRE